MSDDKNDKSKDEFSEFLCGSVPAPDIQGARKGKLRPVSDD